MLNVIRGAILASTMLASLMAAPAKAADINVDGNLKMLCGTVTGAANAATLANKCGVITTESLTTAAGATYTETLTATGVIAATDQCKAYIVASAGAGTPVVTRAVATANTLTILVQNIHASNALNNTIGIGYDCIRP